MMDIESEYEDSISDDDSARGGGGQPLSVHDLLAVVVVLAEKHPDKVPPHNSAAFNETATNLYRPFVDLLNEKVYGDPSSDFIHCTNFPILYRSAKIAMEPIKNEVDEWVDKDIISEAYIAAFIVGDGSIITEKALFKRPYQILAIKGVDHPFKLWLQCHGWWISDVAAVRRISKKLLQSYAFMTASFLLLSYKKLLMSVMMMLAKATRVAATNNAFFCENARVAGMLQAVVFSWLNTIHGIMLTKEWYKLDFKKLTEEPCLFDLSVAGLIGSDGGIYECYQVFQSNKAYLDALAATLFQKYNLKDMPSVKTTFKYDNGIRSRPTTKMIISRRDSEKISLSLASFDMCRKEQHILFILRRLIFNAGPNFPNKKKVEAFLNGTSQFIRKLRPS